MRKAKQAPDVTGDWSTTGTFLRKPAGGWLHEDRELQNGLSVNYSVQYLGSVAINNSMRTLQFTVRTQVTKEAIQRLAENSGNVFLGKKKKVPKQVDKVLGGMDVRWAGEANLSVSVESLKISSELGGMVILNHALPSISFASGGDGATADYIGYVAKDPVNGRACHVFECPRSSQFVLATIGQAFELRYKMYLSSPRSSVQPVEVGSSWDAETWRHSDRNRNSGGGGVVHTTADMHPVPELPRSLPGMGSVDEEEAGGGIYSDIPDIPDLPPPDSTPPPIPSARYTLAERPPARGNGHVPETRPHLDNPYDTMEINTGPSKESTNVEHYESGAGAGNLYEDGDFMSSVPATASARTTSVLIREKPGRADAQPPHEEGGEYSTTFISIRQSHVPSDAVDEILDLTPPPPNHDYTNVDLPGAEGVENGKPPVKRRPPHPPKPAPFKKSPAAQGTRASPPTGNSPKPPRRKHSPDQLHRSPNTPRQKPNYDPPMALKPKPPTKKKPTVTSSTRPGMYDDPDEIIMARRKPAKPSRDHISNGAMMGSSQDDESTVYDLPEEGVYNTPEAVYDATGNALVEGGGASSTIPASPKFDDGIYMDSNGSGAKGSGAKGSGSKGAAKKTGLNRMGSVGNSLPDPLAPLHQQKYYHGALSRVEAEAMLVADGEFLIRESSKKVGQYVLTGMASGKPQHLLLMDKEGRVKSKDREFESVPHLIHHFTESKLPLVIGNSQVFLKRPVPNAFLNS